MAAFLRIPESRDIVAINTELLSRLIDSGDCLTS